MSLIPSGKQYKVRADISELSDCLDRIRKDCGRYPTTKESLEALQTAPKGAKGWHGPYLKQQIPFDAWGNPYVYLSPGEVNHADFTLKSFGEDCRLGGIDRDREIVLDYPGGIVW